MVSSPPPSEKHSGKGPSPILPAVRYALRREDRTQNPLPLHATTILTQGEILIERESIDDRRQLLLRRWTSVSAV